MSKFDHLRGVPGSRSRLAAQVWEGARVEADPAGIPEPSDVAVPEELRANIEHHMSLYPDPRSAVLPALREAQRHHGWLSPEAMVQVAVVMQFSPAYLESVASFYDMLELQPVGTHTIYMCTNLSCQLRGARDVLAALADATGAPVGGSSPDGAFHLRAFECLGACDIAPMASIEGHYRGPLTPADAATIAEHLRSGEAAADVLPDKLPTKGVPAVEKRPAQ
ncbi:MAG TPA: NAD(P)H-dependent oxidoreductase subunit E [Solirubrobacterales bacterium]|nr:NAD(P)H-dependent oxidoreductase subunit E [Solirubrobacterales bacterium]